MKAKKFNKKLALNKKTISNLNSLEQSMVKGGWITYTCPNTGCNTDYKCTTDCEPTVSPYKCVTDRTWCCTVHEYCTIYYC